MHIALEDLQLDHLFVVYPGEQVYPLAVRITAVPIKSLGQAGSKMLFS